MTSETDPQPELVTLFVKALRRLGEAGQVDAACRLGGKAWWVLKDADPRAAERVNGTMHYLVKLPERPAPSGEGGDEDPDPA